MQFYYLFHLRSCAAATAGCCGSAYSGGSRTVFVPSLLETLFLNLFTSVFVYGLPIFLLVAFVLGSAFCVSSNVPTFVYRAAAAPVGAAALPLLDPDRGIRVSSSCKRRATFERTSSCRTVLLLGKYSTASGTLLTSSSFTQPGSGSIVTMRSLPHLWSYCTRDYGFRAARPRRRGRRRRPRSLEK